MLFYDADFAKIDAKYKEESLMRSMQNTKADFEWFGQIIASAESGLLKLFRSKAGSSQPVTIGDVQTNVG